MKGIKAPALGTGACGKELKIIRAHDFFSLASSSLKGIEWFR